MSLLTAPRLIVSQKPKLIEMKNQYSIQDEAGGTLGYVEQEGQSKLRKVLRFATDVDQFLTHRLAIHDASGNKVLTVTRPRKIFKSRFEIEDGTGRRVGEITQKNVRLLVLAAALAVDTALKQDSRGFSLTAALDAG